MTIDNRNEDPNRAMEAFTAPLEIPEPIETPTLSARLRAAADDIQFQGRPDPHDDKALLRAAADEIETLEFASGGATRALLEAQEHAKSAEPAIISALRAVERCQEDIPGESFYRGPGAEHVAETCQLMRKRIDAGWAEQRELSRYIGATFQPGAVDPAAALPAPGIESHEGPAAFAMRLLKLGLSRGAYAPGKHIQTEHGPMLLMQAGEDLHDLAERARIMGANLIAAQDHSPEVQKAALNAAVALLDRLADVLEPVREDRAREMCADDFGPSSACTGDVPPGAAAVDTRFLELFQADPRAREVRFEGMPDIYVPDADAHAIVKTLLSGGEHSAPSWKVISRAAEYFGQRVHVDSGTHKLVLTDSRIYFERTPVEMTPAEMLRGALELAAPGDYADPSPKGQARRALERLGLSVSGIGGTLKLAAAVGIGPACGLSIDDFRPLLAAWNQVGSPSWDAAHLEDRLVDRYAQLKADFFAEIDDHERQKDDEAHGGEQRGPSAAEAENL